MNASDSGAISLQANHKFTLSIFPGEFSLMQVPHSLIGWVFLIKVSWFAQYFVR